VVYLFLPTDHRGGAEQCRDYAEKIFRVGHYHLTFEYLFNGLMNLMGMSFLNQRLFNRDAGLILDRIQKNHHPVSPIDLPIEDTVKACKGPTL
jgi:hypothetical protein